MKKLSILFLSALALSLGSCESDDNSNNTGTNGSLVGKWTYSKVSFGSSGNMIEYPDHEEGCAKDYVEFTSDMQFHDVDYDSFNNPCEEFTDSGTYEREGNTLTINYQGENIATVDIILLTNNELRIKSEVNEIVVFTKQ